MPYLASKSSCCLAPKPNDPDSDEECYQLTDPGKESAKKVSLED